MTSRPRVCTIVLNWNKSALTLDCVAHLQKQSYAEQDLLVVDNGSIAAERDLLRQGLPRDCRCSELAENFGFAGGMNAGLTVALAGGYDFAWLVNNDAFPEPGCLETLVRSLLSSAEAAAVTPLLYGEDGGQQPVGGKTLWELGSLQELMAQELPGELAHGFWLTGAAPLLRLTALSEIGLFDERYFAYWEDVDLCTRLTSRGYRLKVVSEARCLHMGSATSGGARSPFALFLYVRNAGLFFGTHLSGQQQGLTILRLWSDKLQLAGTLHKNGERELGRAILGGLAAVSRNHFGKPSGQEIPEWLYRLLVGQDWWLVPTLGYVHKGVSRCPAIFFKQIPGRDLPGVSPRPETNTLS